jgi:NADH-quinone oxidoreductase subunit J
MTFDEFFFFLIAALSIVSALLMITRRNPVASVMYLILNFFCLAVLYLFLQAQFIAIIQILVYAGAIMVLFLFVIMLLNLKDEQQLSEKINYKKILAYVLSALVFLEMIMALGVPVGHGQTMLSQNATEIGKVENIGMILYKKFFFPFEVTSVLLLAAIIGVIVMAKKRFD